MSSMSQVTNELVTYMDSQTYSQSVDFSSAIVSRTKVEEMGATITGIAYPTTNRRERQDRTGFMTMYGISIAVQKKLQTNDQTEVEGLMDLCEEIVLSLDNVNLASGRIMTGSIDPVFDFERLSEMNVFTSMLTLEVKLR